MAGFTAGFTAESRISNVGRLLNGSDEGAKLFKILYDHETTTDEDRLNLKIDLLCGYSVRPSNITDVLGSDYVPTQEDAIWTLNCNKEVFLWVWKTIKNPPPIELVEERLKTHGFRNNQKELLAYYPDLSAMVKARIIYSVAGETGLKEYIDAEPNMQQVYTQGELMLLLNTLCKTTHISVNLLSHIDSRRLATFVLTQSLSNNCVREIVKMLDHRDYLDSTLAEQIYEAHGFFADANLLLQLADASDSLPLRKRVKVETTVEARPKDECLICHQEPRWFYWACCKPDGSLYDHGVCARCDRPWACLNGHAGHPKLVGIDNK